MSLSAEVIVKKDLYAFTLFIITSLSNSKEDAIKFLSSSVNYVEEIQQNNLKRSIPESDPKVELPKKLQKSEAPAPAQTADKLQKSVAPAAPGQISKVDSLNKLQKSESSASVQIPKVDKSNDDFIIKDEVDTSSKITLAIIIPSDIHLISSIIGKAGSYIGSIYKTSGAKVQIEKEMRHAGPNATRAVFLQGNIVQIMAALKLLYKKIDEVVTLNKNLQKYSESYVIIVPNYLVGNIIGKAGSVVKKIQSTTKAHIDLQTEKAMLDDSSGYYGRSVAISGSIPSRVTAIYQLLRQLATNRDLPQEWKGEIPPRIPFSSNNIMSDSRDREIMSSAAPINAGSRGSVYDTPHSMPPPPSHSSSSSEYLLPHHRSDSSSYGGGAMTMAPSSRSLMPPPPLLPSSSYREFSNVPLPPAPMTRMLTPPPTAGPASQSMYGDSSNRGGGGGGGNSLNIEVKVPKGAVSVIIGPRGAVINDIQRASNTVIQIEKPDTASDPNERGITIIGTPSDIKTALELIEKKIAEWRMRDKRQSLTAHHSTPTLWQRYQSLLYPPHQVPRQPQVQQQQQQHLHQQSLPSTMYLEQQQQQQSSSFGSRDGFGPTYQLSNNMGMKQHDGYNSSSSTSNYAPPGPPSYHLSQQEQQPLSYQQQQLPPQSTMPSGQRQYSYF